MGRHSVARDWLNGRRQFLQRSVWTCCKGVKTNNESSPLEIYITSLDKSFSVTLLWFVSHVPKRLVAGMPYSNSKCHHHHHHHHHHQSTLCPSIFCIIPSSCGPGVIAAQFFGHVHKAPGPLPPKNKMLEVSSEQYQTGLLTCIPMKIFTNQ